MSTWPTTTHFDMQKPASGDLNWGQAFRDNMDIIDSALYSAASAVAAIDISVGEEGADIVLVTLQIQDLAEADIAGYVTAQCWLSDAAYGAECAIAPTGGVTVSTGTELEEITVNKRLKVISDSNGIIVLAIEEAGAKTFYLNAELGGKLYVSAAIIFV